MRDIYTDNHHQCKTVATGGRLTSWLFARVGEKLKLGNPMLQIPVAVRAGNEPGICNSQSCGLPTRPRCVPQKKQAFTEKKTSG